MSDCRKRQVEKSGSEIILRCINKAASAYKGVVEDSICDVCPVKVMMLGAKSLPIIDPEALPPCEYRVNDKTCMVTGLGITKEICNACVAETKTHTASLPDKLINYASSVRRWVASGRPVRSDERVAEIFRDHCSGCKMYDEEKRACKSCGCAVNNSSVPLANKLKMATESCPLNQFEAESV